MIAATGSLAEGRLSARFELKALFNAVQRAARKNWSEKPGAGQPVAGLRRVLIRLDLPLKSNLC